MSDKILLKLDQPAVDFQGDPVILKAGEKLKWGDVLRKVFLATSSPDTLDLVMRYMGWCQSLENTQSIELTAADFESLQSLILKASHNLQLKGPIIMAMKAAKDSSEKVEA